MKSKKKVVIQIETLEADTVLHYLFFFFKKETLPFIYVHTVDYK